MWAIPTEGVVELVGSVLADGGMVEVIWDDRNVMMFTRDLLERGEPI